MKYGKIILAIFGHRYELTWQLHSLHCTGTAFCFHAQCNTGFSFFSELAVSVNVISTVLYSYVTSCVHLPVFL